MTGTSTTADPHARAEGPAVAPVAPAAPAAAGPVRVEMYRMMARMRAFEKRAYDLFLQNLVKGTTHLSLGQEAVAAGFGAAMRRDDYTYATYRGHAHTLARGVPMGPVLAELLGRENGLMAGKGGSMHLTSAEHHMMGSYAIVGAHLPIACGSAFSSQYLGTGQVSVCFFGDGAANIGAFHEALNFARIWDLPVVFVCENNLYMEYTRSSTVTAVAHPAADRAGGYGLERTVVDGNDPDAVYAAAAAALGQARQGGGPALVEALTYRHGGHSRADPGKYRPDDEVAEWLARDPLPMYRDRLSGDGVPETELADIERAVAAEVDEATAFARSGPMPGEALLMKDVWADGGAQWRN